MKLLRNQTMMSVVYSLKTGGEAVYVWILRPVESLVIPRVKGKLEVNQELICEINEIYSSKEAN